MTNATLTTTVLRLADAAGPGLEVRFDAPRVFVAIDQEVFDASGNARGVCRIEIEGALWFGGIVTFGNPPRTTVTNAIAGEELEMARVGRLLAEVLTFRL